jgi:hypothetical protein
MERIALLNVIPAAQMGPAQAAMVEDEREAAFDLLGAQRQHRLADAGPQPRSIAIDGPPGVKIAAPALHIRGFGLRDPGLPGTAGEVLEHGAAVVALVGDQLGRALDGRPAACRVEAPRGPFSVSPSVVVSAWSAAWIAAATIASVSRSTTMTDGSTALRPARRRLSRDS